MYLFVPSSLAGYLEYYHLASIAGDDNQMLIGFNNNNVIAFLLSGTSNYMGTETEADLDMRLLGWKQHCFTWKMQGKFKVSILKLIISSDQRLMYCKVSLGTHKPKRIPL